MKFSRPRFTRREGDIYPLVQDDAFWEQQKDILLAVMVPIWQESYRTGAKLSPVHAEDVTIEKATFDFLISYIPSWWDRIRESGFSPDQALAMAEDGIATALAAGRSLSTTAVLKATTTVVDDSRAGPPKIQQDRLDVEDEVKRAVETAFTFARARLKRIAGE